MWLLVAELDCLNVKKQGVKITSPFPEPNFISYLASGTGRKESRKPLAPGTFAALGTLSYIRAQRYWSVLRLNWLTVAHVCIWEGKGRGGRGTGYAAENTFILQYVEKSEYRWQAHQERA